ncbi:MAG: sodium:alanine symporter family protein [Clostridia bacterium]|nr:sodium:alanine symporter family protein [Clostridia bacterium]
MIEFLSFSEKLISGSLPFAALMLCGIYITVTGNFFQFTRFLKSVKLVIKAFRTKRDPDAGLSSIGAACTALSATVGIGNIAGVAGAISLGGAGAVFWMWISALLGMAIKYAEITLAVKFREKKGNEFIGGPMYYIKNGLSRNLNFIAVMFAVACIPAVFTTGNITQINAAVLSVGSSIPTRLISGISFTVIVFAVIKGGAKRIGAVTEKAVPLMSVLYFLLSLGVIIVNRELLPNAFKMIFEGALKPKAVTGGAVMSVITAISVGASRGIFSNEAGLGTSAMAHSAAYDADAKTQGLYGIFEVFTDTILICTLTALTILCSSVKIDYGTIASSELVASALSVCYGKAASPLLAVMTCFFALSSVLGWALYGDICISFLFGERGRGLFLRIYPLGCIIGAFLNAAAVWRLAAIANGIMLCINLPVMLTLWDKSYIKRDGKNVFKKNSKPAKFSDR